MKTSAITTPRRTGMLCGTGLVLMMLLGVVWTGAGAAQRRPAPGSAAQASSAPLVFDGVTVIDVETGRRLPSQRVVVVGNRIRALGPRGAVPLPPGARVVAARGKYLIPGLWDMHIHLFWAYKALYRQLIANGITGIREAGSPMPLDSFRQWKQEIAAGRRVGPRQIVSAKAINECPNGGGLEWHTCVSSAAQARRLVDSFRTAGADMIKTYALSVPLYFALAAEARRVGIPFGGHLPDGLDGLEASDSGALILDHMSYSMVDVCGGEGNPDHTQELDLVRCRERATWLRRNGTWVTDLFGSGAELPWSDSAKEQLRRDAVRPLSAQVRRHRPSLSSAWATTPRDSVTSLPRGCQAAATTYAANMPLLANTDSWRPNPVILHVRMAAKAACGVPPLWVLQTATLNPARALGLSDSLGTVAVGKVADLVLLDADPLLDIGNVTRIEAVVANGRYFDRAALDRLLVEAAQLSADAPKAP